MSSSGGIAIAIVGGSGLTGSAILNHLLNHPSVEPVHAIARKTLSASSKKLQVVNAADSSTWAGLLPGLNPKPSAFVSAIGTTRGAAGSLEAQRAIDYDLNLQLANAAQDAGIDTYVLVSSGGSSSASRMPYLKMKGELEDEVKKLRFKHTVILRPGLLVGDRTESRPAEGIMRGIAKGLAALSPKLTEFWAQDVDTIARAATKAIVDCADGKHPDGIWVLEQADIVKMGGAGAAAS